MDWTVMHRRRRREQMPVLLASYLARSALRWIVIIAWMLAGFLLPPMVQGALTDREDEFLLEPERRGILQAHPEWPAEVRAAVMAGIICEGMSPDMVRAAWGQPTRMSGKDVPDQTEIWYYEGRPRAVERLGRQEMREPRAREWTVSFIGGRVVGWTD